MRTLKVIVQPTQKCLELLRYIYKNIDTIINFGAHIQVDKIDKDNVDESIIEIFRKKGITRLPVLLSPEGKIFTGLKQIMDNFESALRSTNAMSTVAPMHEGITLGSNIDMSDFWLNELYAGIDHNGKMIVRSDKDEVEENDIEKRLSEYQRNTPRHRRTGTERDNSPPHRRDDRMRRARDEDNIADDDVAIDEPHRDHNPIAATPTRGKMKAPRLMATGDARGDDMDQRILAALMDNNCSET